MFSGEGSLLLTDSVLQSVSEPQIDYTRNETRLMLRNQGKILEAHRELIETLNRHQVAGSVCQAYLEKSVEKSRAHPDLQNPGTDYQRSG